MSAEIKDEKSLQDIEKNFIYNANFDKENVRRFLNLDGERSMIGGKLPVWEVIRLAEMLERGGDLTGKDVETLRSSISREDNPFEKKICSKHGEWYHDVFGCMHHDHIKPPQIDKPPGDKVCKD
jgi:hypothetical protein